MTTLALVIAVSLGISFVCSVLEAVLLSVTHGYVALLEEQDDPAGALLARLRARIDEPIAAILTLNTIAHTVGAALSGAIALQVLGSRWMAAFSAVLTLLILVLSEIIPKTLGARHWQRLAPLTARILRAMLVAMKPILAPLAVLNRLVGASGHGGASVSRAELEVLAEVGRREGQIDDTEWRVVSNAMRLRDRTVGEVMTPRTSMVALPEASTPQQAQALMLDTGYLRLPVYAGTVDQIIGVLVARDLWRGMRRGVTSLPPLLREPLFVPESRPVDSLIVDMRAQRMKMAIVLDEYGGTAGLVTLEDLVEEIVGEIQDEHESADQPFERVGASEVLAHGGTSLSQLAEALDLTLPSEEFESIGGFVFGRLGRLPQVGDTVTEAGVIVRVLAMDRRRVARVSLQLTDTSPPVGANED